MTTKVLFFLLIITTSQADIIVNAARPITHKVLVNRIRTQDGANQAKTFGTASQETNIVDSINEIWAQAGVRVIFSDYSSYESAFAYDNNGQDPDTVRLQAHLSTMLNLSMLPPRPQQRTSKCFLWKSFLASQRSRSIPPMVSLASIVPEPPFRSETIFPDSKTVVTPSPE